MSSDERHLTDEELGPVLRGEAMPDGSPLPKQPCPACGELTIWAGVCDRCIDRRGEAHEAQYERHR